MQKTRLLNRQKRQKDASEQQPYSSRFPLPSIIHAEKQVALNLYQQMQSTPDYHCLSQLYLHLFPNQLIKAPLFFQSFGFIL
ncbi:hypothetical protein ADJ77_02955 [Prevotella fusca JCM 17724]|uniref:Uncharacterized protein n=1 Tax=Prevotella fusca JCM 17724 TaxID=1236517 RepID=A0A0K1NIF0_9BACT|nr:hypothetical protein ADJ77_02955 [Prevotella fusca JCM 17724]